IEEVIKSLIEQGEIYREGDTWGRRETHELSIPQSVKEAIGRRLARLGEPTVDALRTAAALGKHFLFGELAVVSSASDDVLLDALDEASAAQLVRATSEGPRGSSGTGDAFAFTHDKIREVLYEELNPIRRRRLHQRIGEALETLHGTVPAAATAADERAQDLAHHFTLAGDLARALAYSRRAARHAERVFAHDEALKFLEQARESAESLRQVDDLAEIDEQIGDIREMRGMTHPAVQSYDRALGTASTRGRRAAIKAKIGSTYCAVGDPRGLTYVEQALAELDATTQANALAIALANMGRYYHYRTEHRKAIEFLERARRLAEPLDDPLTVGQIYLFLAGAHQHLTLFDDSDRWARACVALGERTNFPTIIAGGYEFLGENAAGRGHWDDAMAFGRKDREHGEKSGSLARVAWSQFCELQAQYGKGELVAGYATAAEALELCEQIGENRLATWIVPMKSIFEADMGNDEAARGTAERGSARAQQLGQLVLSAWALHAAGYAAMQRGDFNASLGWYDQYVKLVQDTENRAARLLPGAFPAEAYACAGRLDEATRLVDEDRQIAEFAKSPHRVALARRVQGQILVMQERYDDALNAFDEAIAIFTRIGSRLELARAIYQRAALGLVRGDASENAAARRGAARARDEFAAMGAARDRARAEQSLRS
ncbi:MAG: ATP-binding protein, partial [Sphingomicrobium sp.]